MTSCSASEPGRRWQKLSARTNSSSLIHLLRSTSWRCMRPIWPTGPPNASQPSLRKYQKISGIETCCDSEGCASARFGSPSSTPAHLAPTRVAVRSSAARRPRARSCGGIVRTVLRVITPGSMCSPVLRARPFAARWPGRAGGSPQEGAERVGEDVLHRLARRSVTAQVPEVELVQADRAGPEQLLSLEVSVDVGRQVGILEHRGESPFEGVQRIHRAVVVVLPVVS